MDLIVNVFFFTFELKLKLMEKDEKTIAQRVEIFRHQIVLNAYQQSSKLHINKESLTNEWGNSTSWDKGDDWENFNDFNESR